MNQLYDKQLIIYFKSKGLRPTYTTLTNALAYDNIDTVQYLCNDFSVTPDLIHLAKYKKAYKSYNYLHSRYAASKK